MISPITNQTIHLNLNVLFRFHSRARTSIYSAHHTSENTDFTITAAMALNQPVWAASARRRRFILNRYGRGPRKKPPDPPDPPDRAQQAAALPTKQISSFRLRRWCGICYPRDHRATLHPELTTKLPSVFLAGKRHPFHRISPSYRRLFLSQLHHGGRHGHIGSSLATSLSERCANGTFLNTTFKAVYWVSITNSILNQNLNFLLLICAIGLFITNKLFHSPKFHQRQSPTSTPLWNHIYSSVNTSNANGSFTLPQQALLWVIISFNIKHHLAFSQCQTSSLLLQ
jgi:hypothetical protein